MRTAGWLLRAGVLVIGAGAASVAARGQSMQTPAGMRAEAINDPSLGMKAFDVYVPSKWHFAGVLVQGTNCMAAPFPVFRATSPDGLTILERFPRMDWQWGNAPGAVNYKDCLPLKQEMTAKQFLKYMAAAFHMQYVGDDPYPADVVAKSNAAAQQSQAANAQRYRNAGMIPPVEHMDMDRILVSYRNGSFTIKGQMAASLYCATNSTRGLPSQGTWSTHSCNVTVRLVRAPEAQFQAAVRMLDPAGAAQNAAWSQAWAARSAQQTQQRMAANAAWFQQQQAARTRMHEEFMATMQRGTDMSMQRTQQAQQARSAAAANWCDYALDQQTVRDPNTGQTSKVSNQYTYTWVDSSGKTSYQTNDVNANPNGSMPGNWSRQQVVNGDGSSR